jgi:nitrogen fixation-related uncharacterized protein
MMCPNCLSGGLGPGWYAAFAICILFFLLAGVAMFWASKSGRLQNLESAKHKMLQDD